jgi:hypothetical protein
MPLTDEDQADVVLVNEQIEAMKPWQRLPVLTAMPIGPARRTPRSTITALYLLRTTPAAH